MPLVECKECTKSVSESASECPRCGISLPGMPDDEIQEISNRIYFMKHRWISGAFFWPGVVWLLIPVFTKASKSVFLEHWNLSKWLIAAGFIWYIFVEIQRNIYEKMRSSNKT